MLKCLIVEDERKDAAELKQLLRELDPDIECTVFEHGLDAVDFIQNSKDTIDLFFIDRDLPGIDGFKLASQIREMEKYVLAPIIFVTGYAMGQLDAFHEYHCYSYLVKPLSKERTFQQIGRLVENLRSIEKKPLRKIIPLLVENDKKYIAADDILGVEVMGKNCFVYTVNRRYRLPRQTMEQVLREIDEPYCIRCHKSFALNLKHVTDISKERRNLWKPEFVSVHDFDCVISKTYYAEVMKKYKEYLSQKQCPDEERQDNLDTIG